MEKIWRVENREGRGPYVFNEEMFDYEGPLDIHNKFNGHPAPLEDKGIERNVLPHEVCGFKTLNQAHAWFSEEDIIWMEQFGFYLKQIDVKSISAEGQYQVLAIK